MLFNLRNEGPKLWGRALSTTADNGTADKEELWERAHFDYSFLSSDSGCMPHSPGRDTSPEHEHLSQERTFYLIFLPKRFKALLDLV